MSSIPRLIFARASGSKTVATKLTLVYGINRGDQSEPAVVDTAGGIVYAE